MARIEEIKYQCDICKRKFDKENDISSTHVPCFGGERYEYETEAQIDLCKECSQNLRKIIYDNFAEIQNYYGIHITNKQKS